MGIPLPREREFERGILVWIWDRRDVWVGLKPTERLQASRGRRQGRRTRRTKTLSEVNGEVRLKKRLTQPTLLETSGSDFSTQECAPCCSGTSWVITLNCRKFAVPKDVVSATSDASRPTAINTRPMRG